MQEHIVYKKVKDFNDEQIKTIALRYANTSYDYSSRAIAVEFSRDGEYSILPRTILKLIQKAIKNALVSEETARKIREKAVHNSSLYNKNCAQKTRDFYTSLILQRREFLENGKKRKRKSSNANNTNNTKEILSFSVEQKTQERLKYLEDSLATINHHIEIFDLVNEQEITLDELLSQKRNLEKEIKDIKNYWKF